MLGNILLPYQSVDLQAVETNVDQERRDVLRFVAVLFCSLIVSSCATVFPGYESELVIHNCPDSLRVFTSNGVEPAKSFDQTKVILVPEDEHRRFLQEAVDSSAFSVQLRSNKDYILLLRNGNTEYPYLYMRR